MLFSLLFILSLNSTCQVDSNSYLLSKSLQLINTESLRITGIDTVYNDSTGIRKMIGYDSNNSVVKIQSTNLNSSLGLVKCRIELFDTDGNLLLEQIKNHDDII